MPNLFFIKDIKKSNSSCTNFDGKKKYIATADLQNGKIVNYEVVDFNSKPSRANLIAVNGSVIFAKMQNTIKVLEIDDSNVDNIYSTGFYSFKDERILPSYMKFFFESTLFNTIKDKNCHGATMKAVNDEEMSKISINVPSIQIQQKIIDELSKITELINFNKNNLVNLDKVVKSQFIEMFGKLEDTEYPIDTLNNICEFIKDGTHQTPTYTEDEDGYIFVSSKDVTSGKIDWDNTKRIPKELHEQLYSRIAPKKNDILLSKNGTIGFAVLVEDDRIFDIYVSLAILRQNKLNPVFMKEQLNAEDCQKQFYSSLKGVGVPNLHLGEIKKTKVIVPPIELQNKFADFVQQIDKSKFIVQKQIKLLEELLEKKMNEYFGN